MSTKNKTLKPKPATDAELQKLRDALNELFQREGIEIDDEVIGGRFARRIGQLEAQVKSLTGLLGQLSAQVNGKPVTPSGRVDAIAASKSKTK